MAELTRNRIMEMGLVAAQAGFSEPEELMQCITRGMQAEWRIPLAVRYLDDVRVALRGMAE